MKILLIDNFDSFTFNLSHYLKALGVEVEVIRENEYTSDHQEGADRIVLSPGPGLPKDSAGMLKCLEDSIGRKPILGVCLGMQAIAEFTGGKLYNQNKVKHGVQEYIDQLGDSILFQKVPNRFQVGLYHSWAVELPFLSHFDVTAISSSGVIMAIESVKQKLFGVQFHPESIMTPNGKTILKNFLEQ